MKEVFTFHNEIVVQTVFDGNMADQVVEYEWILTFPDESHLSFEDMPLSEMRFFPSGAGNYQVALNATFQNNTKHQSNIANN